MDEIEAQNKMSPVTTVQTAGEKIYNIDHVENAGNIQNNVSINVNGDSVAILEQLIKSLSPDVHRQRGDSHAMEWASLDCEHYCLFVLENEVYRKEVFSMSKDVSLEEHTAGDIREKYWELNPGQREAIKNMPCIFARRNTGDYKMAGNMQTVCVGKLTDIYVQDETIKFYFSRFADVPQQLLNEQEDYLGMWHLPLRNELDFEHWSIIKGNLIQVLSDLGVAIQ